MKRIELPEGLKDIKAPNQPELCEKIDFALRGACLQFGQYNPSQQSFIACDESEATQALVIVPKGLKQILNRSYYGRRSTLEKICRRSDFYFEEKTGKERFYAIIGYHNGEFSKGVSSRVILEAVSDYCLHGH